MVTNYVFVSYIYIIAMKLIFGFIHIVPYPPKVIKERLNEVSKGVIAS